MLLLLVLLTSVLNAQAKWPNAATYEIFVQAFCDSNGDGIGDFNGITSKLDYLKDLGIKGLWLMPIHPSQSEHKYDVMDYYSVHKDYGTMEDFRRLIAEAHKRDIKIIIDLVVNHTSRNHPWFLASESDTASPYRDYYVWADEKKMKEMGETKKAAADSDNRRVWSTSPKSVKKYYAHFGGGMPDLNFDNPAVRQEIFKMGRFWLKEVGIDGFRLDAAKHIYPDNRAADNHQWWKEFKAEMEKAKPDMYIVGEVWADAETVAPYFQGLNAVFNFDMGYAITKAARDESDGSIASRLAEIRKKYHQYSPNYYDATFLTNHDQTREMSELSGEVNKGKMAAALLLTLPGSPYIYYGEEIGMLGRKPDRNIREPFVWGSGKDNGQVTWMTPKYSNAETVVPAGRQLDDPSSMLNHYRKLLKVRNSSDILTYGEIVPVEMNDKRLIGFKREYKGKSLLVIHNLSKEDIKVENRGLFRGFSKVHFTTASSGSFNANDAVIPAYSTYILK